jgi:hypothetical protein
MGNEDNQKLVDALNIVYNEGWSNINKSVKLVDALWDVYHADDTLETNWDIRDKITDGFKQSGFYKEFLSQMEGIITDKFNVNKNVATHTLLEMMLRDKVNVVDERFGEKFQTQLKHYNQLQSEIAELNNEINNC